MSNCEITTTTTTRQPQFANCAQCGQEVKANVQMLSDAPIVCSKCRCSVCRIVLSNAVCRCGARHGKPSSIKQVCERCYTLLEAGSFADLSLGILESAISPDEEALGENNLMEDDLEEDLQGTDDHEAHEDEMGLSENDENDLEEFLVESSQSLLHE